MNAAVTKPDHDLIRLEAHLALSDGWPRSSSVSGYDLARYCLALLAEMEKVPALVETVRWFVDGPGDLASLVDALAAWDETP